ncbi:hypothetical protein GWI33_003646 [Rhynchophorus ferrugineus]|uniref:Solute-binding protein family 3/N-terminal domain-containing protein n=1 Tax=Rhynchophorus ferrugineus TaxID=354439 RepID=A0A834M106_RHYFE|nr:hypothetical protein GWI33_003646 [Rhynchophorus ferrugineus]
MAGKSSIFIITCALVMQGQALDRKLKFDKTTNIFVWDGKRENFLHYNGNTTLSEAYKTNNHIASLRNTVVRVIVDDMDPYINSDSIKNELSGFLGELWNIIQDMLQFQTKFKRVEYTHGLTAIEQNEADVFLASVVYKTTLNNVTFSHPYFNVWYNLYFKLPEGKPPTYLHFTVFSTDLWIKILCVFLLITLLLWFSCKALGKVMKNSEVVLSLPTCFLGIISAFANTGFDLKLRSNSTRMQMFYALFFGSLCYYALCASLVARLAVLVRTPPFSDLYEVSSKNAHTLCLRNNSFVYNNFTDTNKTILPRWKGLLNTDECPNMLRWQNIPEVICRSNFLVLENRILMSLVLNERLFCTVSWLPQKYFPSGNFFLTHKKFRGIKPIHKS